MERRSEGRVASLSTALLSLIGENMETKMIDRLYLELSQVTKAVTNKEAMYRREVARLQGLLGTLRAEAFALLENDDTDKVDALRDALRVAAKDAV